MESNKRATLALALMLGTSAATAQTGFDFEVLSVLAPGSGSNYVEDGETPAGTDSQVEMYDGLPRALPELDESTLRDFFKPASFDVAPEDVASEISPRLGFRRHAISRNTSPGSMPISTRSKATLRCCPSSMSIVASNPRAGA